MHDDAKLRRAFAIHKAGDAAKALALYEEVLAAAPAHAGCLNLAGLAAQDLGQFSRAEAALRAAIAASPGVAAYRTNLAALLRAAGHSKQAAEIGRAAVALDPGNASAHNNLANALRDLGQFDAAIAHGRQAVALQPDDADICANLADILQAADDLDAALAQYDAALRLAPKNWWALRNKASAMFAIGDVSGAIACGQEALKVAPNDAATHHNLGLACLADGQHARALAAFARAKELQPAYAQAHFGTALCQLVQGNFGAGFRNYEWRWQAKGDALWEPGVPQWRGGSDIAGKRLLLFAEQGLGDTIQFARYARLAAERGAYVVLRVPGTLQALAAGVPGVAAAIAENDPLPPVDLCCPLLSLPLAFGTRVETIPAGTPYLRADPTRVARWRERLGEKKGPRIGLVWSGNANHRNDRRRSIPLGELLAIVRDGIEFVSLQNELRATDSAILENDGRIRHFGDLLADFSDTAALAVHMDFVVSVDTSVLHLVGALGIRGLALIPFDPDWRWLLAREDSPWYPTLRLARQTRLGDWSHCLAVASAEVGRLSGDTPTTARAGH